MKNRFPDDEGFPEDLFPGFNEDDEEGEDEEYDPSLEDDAREADEIAQAIELERRELNQRILFRTIRSLERGWFWRFRSRPSKMRLISETYLNYQRLVTHGEFHFIDYTKEKV